MEVSYHILKKVAVIRELDYNYYIDEDGYGSATIEGIKVSFFVDQYGYIDLSLVKYI